MGFFLANTFLEPRIVLEDLEFEASMNLVMVQSTLLSAQCLLVGQEIVFQFALSSSHCWLRSYSK